MSVKKSIKVFLPHRAFINLGRDGVVVKVPVSNILYIEKFEHTLIYYTEFGEFKKKMSLKDVEEKIRRTLAVIRVIPIKLYGI